PFAQRLFARENKMKLSFAKGFEWLLSVNIVGAAIPNHDRAAAVLPLRNNSLKAFIIDRMIFDFDGEMFFAFLPRQTLWQCPRFQNALHLEAKIVMQAARGVFLNYKSTCAANLLGQRFAAFRLGRLRKIALRLVFLP